MNKRRRLTIGGRWFAAVTLVSLLVAAPAVVSADSNPSVVAPTDLVLIDTTEHDATITDDFGNTVTVASTTRTYAPAGSSITAEGSAQPRVSCTYSVTMTDPYESPSFNTAHGYISGTVSSGCTSVLFIEHALYEDQGLWDQRDFSNVFVDPGTTDASTVQWQCDDDLNEQWQHKQTNPDLESQYATLACNS